MAEQPTERNSDDRSALAAEIREFIETETEVDPAMIGQGDYPQVAALLREAGR